MSDSIQWPIREVTATDRGALAVWVILTRIADRTCMTMVQTNRKALARESGLGSKDLRAISKSLKVLEQAGWIHVERTAVREPGNKYHRVMRIWLRLSPVNFYSGMLGTFKMPRRQRKPKTAVAAAQDAVQPDVPVPPEFFPDEPALLRDSLATLSSLKELRTKLAAAYNDLATGASKLPQGTVNKHGQNLHAWRLLANERIEKLEKESA